MYTIVYDCIRSVSPTIRNCQKFYLSLRIQCIHSKSTIMAKEKVISFRVSEKVYDVLTILSGGKLSEYMRHLTITHTQHGLTIWGEGMITAEALREAGMSIPMDEFLRAPLTGSPVIHGTGGPVSYPVDAGTARPRRVHLDHSEDSGIDMGGEDLKGIVEKVSGFRLSDA